MLELRLALLLALTGSLFRACAHQQHVRGAIVAPAPAEIECEIELHDHGYRDGRVLARAAVRTGQNFSTRLQNAANFDSLSPVSEVQDILIKCPGFQDWSTRFERRPAAQGLDLGRIVLVASGAKQ